MDKKGLNLYALRIAFKSEPNFITVSHCFAVHSFGPNYLRLSSIFNYIECNNGIDLCCFGYWFAPIPLNIMHIIHNCYEIVRHYIRDRNFLINISNIFGITLGPDFWGRLNPKWSLCSRGRRQSPINIDPQLLLFDPNLVPLQIHGDYVSSLSLLLLITH